MKKYLFLAATAMMFAACSNEEVAGPQVIETNPGAVAFDTYTSAATRAGYANVMTTEKLKKADAGFGVYAYYTNDNDNYSSTLTPDFMFNQKVTWSGGWTYFPLKYWPNETTSDMHNATGHASSTATDKLSFFAYAPYVSETATLSTKDNTTISLDGGTTQIYAYHATETSGISAISADNYDKDPVVEWKVSTNPDNNVDLLWGVAPAGLSYQAVNGSTITATEGKPIVNMVKPDKDQKIKFLFEHALSRIGLTVVSAIDQVADGGTFNTAESRVLIDEVIIYGNFGTQGALNLNNGTPHVANWIEESVVRTPSTEGSPLFTINATNGYLNPDLRYDAGQITGVTSAVGEAAVNTAFAALNDGVLTSEQDLLVGGADPSKVATGDALEYAYGKTLYKLDGVDYKRATTTATAAADVFTKDGSNNYTQFAKSSDPAITLNGTKEYFTLAATAKTVDKTSDPLNPVDDLTPGAVYYSKAGTEAGGDAVYTKFTATGSEADGTYYELAETPVAGNDYTGTCYTALTPRYFMVIPSALTPTPTEINVKITYHVVTKDAKLTNNVSNVTNAITKTTSIQLVNGKSYNLKLILGLTSVKLDATVKDWEVADETELNLPKNED